MDKTNILVQMEAVVKAVMTSNLNDFYKYDVASINSLSDDDFPLIWMCNRYSTHLYRLPEIAKALGNKNSQLYWEYLKTRELPYLWLADPSMFEGYFYFLIQPDGISQIQPCQLKEVLRDTLTPTIERIKAENDGRLPEYRRIDLEVNNLSSEQMNAILKDCKMHGDSTLQRILDRLTANRSSENHQLTLHYEGRKFYVYVTVAGKPIEFFGAIVFHGWPETGYRENGSVMIEPQYGWHLHT